MHFTHSYALFSLEDRIYKGTCPLLQANLTLHAKIFSDIKWHKYFKRVIEREKNSIKT